MIDKILKKFLKNDPDKKCITDSKKTYTFKEINDFYEEKAAAQKNEMSAGKTSLVNSEGKVNAPQFKQASKAYEGKSSYK